MTGRESESPVKTPGRSSSRQGVLGICKFVKKPNFLFLRLVLRNLCLISTFNKGVYHLCIGTMDFTISSEGDDRLSRRGGSLTETVFRFIIIFNNGSEWRSDMYPRLHLCPQSQG